MSLSVISSNKYFVQNKNRSYENANKSLASSLKDTVSFSARSEEDKAKLKSAKKWILIGLGAGVVATGLIFHKRIWNIIKG